MSSVLNDSAAEPLVQVQASTIVTKQALEVTVRVRNSSSDTVYVFSRPEGASKFGAPPGAGALFSQVSFREDGLLALGMIVPRVPPGMAVEVLYVPCAILLAPGADLKERAEIPLPIVEYSPYRPHNPKASYELVKSNRGEVWVDHVAATSKISVAPGPASDCFRVTGFSRGLVLRAVAPLGELQVPVNRRVVSHHP